MHHAKAIGANILWGMVPAYYYLVSSVEPLRMTSYRFVFTFLLLACVSLLLKQRFSSQLLKSSFVPAILLSVNAYVYLVAVLHGYVLEAVYGYLITPVLTIALGGLMLRESLSSSQLAGSLICLSAIVLYAILNHTLPWFGIGIAFPFSLYLIWHRRRGTRSSIEALKHESLVMLILPMMLIASSWGEVHETVVIELGSWLGPVIAASGLMTVAPLAMYVSSSTGLPTVYLGIYQFLSPIISSAIAIALFGEPLTAAKIVTGIGLAVGLGVISFPQGKRLLLGDRHAH